MPSRNFNKSPYFDDYSAEKNFKQVLFNAGRPVQARELNQLQTIQQQQRAAIANNLFKNGTRISGGTPTFNSLGWVRLNTGADVSWYIKGCIAVGAGSGAGDGSGVEARVVAMTPETSTDPATLFVVYTKTGVDGETISFINGEMLQIMSEDKSVELSTPSKRPKVRCPSCAGNTDTIASDATIKPTGNKARQLVVEEGIWYWDGYFINTPKVEYIYSKYDEKITAKIGFDVVDEIITHEDDSSLLDNALGYPNETAPGADRYKISLNLNRRNDVPQDGDKFIIICTIDNGEITSVVQDTQYNKIMDIMAQRTYEESGDYTVKPFKVKYVEHKGVNANDPLGATPTGNKDYVRCIVSDGLAYVRGYRQEKTFESVFDVKKARDTLKAEDGAVYFPENAYIDLVLSDDANAWANNSETAASLLTDEKVELKDGDIAGGSATGSTIGYIKVWDVVPHGKDSNNKPVYRYYISDVVMNQGKSYADVKSVTNVAANFIAKPLGEFKVFNSSQTNLFWKVSTPFIKSMRDVDNQDKGSIILTRRVKLNATLDAKGVYKWDTTSNLFNNGTDNVILSVKDGGTWKMVDPAGKVNPAGNSVTVNLGAGMATRDVMLVISATAINLTEKTKTLVQGERKSFTGVDTKNFTEKLNLGKADIYRITAIVGDNGDNLLDKFSFDGGQTPTAYREGKIINTVPLPLNQYNGITVTFDYFSHSDVNQAGFFTIDSYKEIIKAPDNDIDYGSLPNVKGADGTSLSAADVIDFRPMILNGNISQSYMPTTGSTMIHDAEFYVARKDLIIIDKDGNISEQMGVPASKPEFPHVAPNSLALFQVYFPPYTFSYADIKVTMIENKRYTMRDIGKLEKRIDNLEYYTVLSLSEQAVADAKVKDANGLDRYKNGFIVDNFTTYGVAHTASTEFRGLKDDVKRIFRPNTGMFNRKLIVTNSDNNVTHEGKIITLSYQHKIVDEQPFASKSVSINECFIYTKKGTLILSPNVDTWSDITREAKQEWNIDTGTEAIQGLAGHINKVQKDFNDFQLANQTVTRPISPINQVTKTVNTFTATRNDTRVVDQTRNGWFLTTTTQTDTYTDTVRTSAKFNSITSKESRIGTQTTNYAFDRVTDVQILPYMRETTIRFHAEGLLPKTKMYVFFDNVNVTEFCSANNPAAVSEPLSTDANGVCEGVFTVPAGRFFNGTKLMKITNDKTNSGDVDMELCMATAQFFAGGVNQKREEISINVISPTYSQEDVSTGDVEVPNSRTNEVISSVITNSTISRSTRNTDPIAQSFTLNHDAFLLKMDLYFHEKGDEGENLWLEIRTMENGYPSSKGVLVRAPFTAADVNISDDASVATTIELPHPVFVSGGVEYCFVIGGDSPRTKAWVSKLGGEAVNYGNKIIDTQPSVGSRFRSQNGTTWNAEQFEDIMYRMYACYFPHESFTIKLALEDTYDYEELANAPFECEQGSDLVRVHCKNGHGFIKNDKVIISTIENEWVKVKLTSGKLVEGHVLKTTNDAVATVAQVRYDPADSTSCEILLRNTKGLISNNDTFITNTFNKSSFEPSKYARKATHKNYVIPVASGQIKSGLEEHVGHINGITFDELNKEHNVIAVDDPTSFVIQVNSQALKTGRYGFNTVRATMSHKFEMMNLSGSILLYDGEESWTMKALKHGDAFGVYANDNYGYGDSMAISRNENTYMPRAYKVPSQINSKAFAGGNSAVEFTLTCKRNKNNPWVTPVINIDTLSATFLSNMISMKNEDNNKISPNKDEIYIPETDPVKGSELYKYVSKTITLDEPAADLKIWFDVNRPVHTDFDVYIKTAEKSGQEIDDKPWVKLEGYQKDVIHNDVEDFTEIEILVSKLLGQQLPLFSACKVKIVGTSKQSANVPVFKALRVVALT